MDCFSANGSTLFLPLPSFLVLAGIFHLTLGKAFKFSAPVFSHL